MATVKQLTELLEQVKDEQSYIVIRERTHRNTAESTNARVKWWSIFQLGVLLGEGVFQVWWLKRFFEVSDLPHARCLACQLGSTDIALLHRSSVLYEETMYHLASHSTNSCFNTSWSDQGPLHSLLAMTIFFALFWWSSHMSPDRNHT